MAGYKTRALIMDCLFMFWLHIFDVSIEEVSCFLDDTSMDPLWVRYVKHLTLGIHVASAAFHGEGYITSFSVSGQQREALIKLSSLECSGSACSIAHPTPFHINAPCNETYWCNLSEYYTTFLTEQRRCVWCVSVHWGPICEIMKKGYQSTGVRHTTIV